MSGIIPFENFLNPNFLTNYKKRLELSNFEGQDPVFSKTLENRRLWSLFKRALSFVMSVSDIQKVSSRYLINISEMQKDGRDLLPVHIQCFALTYLGSKKTESPVTSKATEFLEKRAYHTFQQAANREFRKDFQRFMLLKDAHQLSKKQYMEILAKKIANGALEEGMQVQAPLRDGQGGIGHYEVYRIIRMNGLIAYALKPQDHFDKLKPIILFRPTQTFYKEEYFLETLVNDFDSVVGKWGYSRAKESLGALVKDPSFTRGELVWLCGHSLAGAHSQLFLVDYADFVSRAYFFNDPSLQKELNDKFIQRFKSRNVSHLLKIKVYRTDGDPIHAFGKEHVGYSMATIPSLQVQVNNIVPDVESASVFQLHNDLVLHHDPQCPLKARLAIAKIHNQTSGVELSLLNRAKKIQDFERRFFNVIVKSFLRSLFYILRGIVFILDMLFPTTILKEVH